MSEKNDVFKLVGQSVTNELDDLSPMPWGKFRGVPMQDVPVDYLHWAWHEGPTLKKKPNDLVGDYIRKNLQALKLENEDLIWS